MSDALARVTAAAEAVGLGVVGAFDPAPEETEALGLPATARGVALLGYDGPAMWTAFSRAPEASDGAQHPLDRWTRRIGDAMAAELGHQAAYPFGAPPTPFIRWAVRAGGAWSSPLGMLIHAERGLWPSYRLALISDAPLDAPAPTTAERPCDSCAGQPCLTACPVDAFSPDGYDVAACAAHLRHPEGADCREMGCRARRACPVGVAFAHEPAQAAFHMRAFLDARPLEDA